MIKSTLAIPCADNDYLQEHVLIMLENLKKWTGFDLIKEYGFSLDKLGEQIFNADFYILSHDTGADPILNYGNDRVLKQWEVSWEELTNMHSRETAKPVDRSDRSTAMEHVKKYNYISGYSGKRISKTGKEFQILDVTIWNLFTNNGDSYGQAAWFRSIGK
ncbi:MEKHLA domain-containing protein [Chamaesiphon sp. VAR_48_metabat_135_sub]|uniref:MEKHLA domain-containing protein n=1 Tax=Chamaesiphon sp. VAR_48_metabat_135_sub TaxID=2964699 RepID=UPI00286C4F1A|nr:MEKHLA domain-containing protein [Chamaesiphon sp. VAR_48_metabat_135_sub]